MFLSYVIFFCLFDQIDSINRSSAAIPTLEQLFPLYENDQRESIAQQFGQDPVWEHGGEPLPTTVEEETAAGDSQPLERPPKPGVIKDGHSYSPRTLHPYAIDREGVHPDSTHHIFLVRHGLYFFSEDDATSHLLRYGKYQARMAGQQIDDAIQSLIQNYGPLTRPIKLVSSTQTRAYETLYNIRLQLNNHYTFEPEIIQDTGLTECTDQARQRVRWAYFVREYLQPIQSKVPENTVMIIASHGNLLTSFQYILSHFIPYSQDTKKFMRFQLPRGTGLLHAQAVLFRMTGTHPAEAIGGFLMNQIPVTINHAQFDSDFYYRWAALAQCRSDYARENMQQLIQSSIIDRIFTDQVHPNRIPNYVQIVFNEMVQEFESHILPVIMITCRKYHSNLMMIRVNTDFLNFNRDMSPVPLPQSDEENQRLLTTIYPAFHAYAMPFPVIHDIELFQKKTVVMRPHVAIELVHPESRVFLFMIRHGLNVHTGDDRTSYISRFGVNQIRGTSAALLRTLSTFKEKLPHDAFFYPATIVHDPTVYAAHSCAHIRHYLSQFNYTVAEQMTDLGIEVNHFKKNLVHEEYAQGQRAQINYILERYLAVDKNKGVRPTVQIHILCGDGRLFSAFRQELAMRHFLNQPVPRFPFVQSIDVNALKHGDMFLFEAIGNDDIKLWETFELRKSREMKDVYKFPTQNPLTMRDESYEEWFRSPDGPCTLSYFKEKQDRLIGEVIEYIGLVTKETKSIIVHEWDPYLAGMFMAACRHYYSRIYAKQQCQTAAAGEPFQNATACEAAASASGGPSPDACL